MKDTIAGARIPRLALRYLLAILAGLLPIAEQASAQNQAYRQTNLASNVPGFADVTDPFLRNPWGIAIVPRVSFFIANDVGGRAIQLDGAGNRAGAAGFTIPNPSGTGPAIPTGMIADPNSLFRAGGAVPPFQISTITATLDGALYFWQVNADGSSAVQATLAVDNSRAGAVYTGLAILAPDCCAPFLAVANFHSGSIEAYTPTFDRLAPPGTFTDPGLPAGYAPFGMQLIGNRLFVTYALQDGAKQNPVVGAGNGIVSIFDLEGNFVRRFATAGTLNAPWGIAQVGANFGPFSNDILIANIGDGAISAFDPATANFAGQIQDGDGTLLSLAGLRALAFRSDGFGDPNALYFTEAIGNGQDGLFGKLTAGLVSTTRVSVPSTRAGTSAAITVTVSAGPGNSGAPKGMVALQLDGAPLAEVAVTDGVAAFDDVLRGVGVHVIKATYEGDDTFLPSSSQTDVEVTGPATTVTLTAPAEIATGSSLTLTATITSSGGTPTGQVSFLEGGQSLGSALLNASGVAALTVNNLAAGSHSITASYPGDGEFAGSVSAPFITVVAARDFSFAANPPLATVAAGQSVNFSLTVTPAGGFNDPVTFSCPTIAGIACTFDQPTVTPNGASSGTTLRVTTSAGVTQFGQIPGGTGRGTFPAALGALALMGILAAIANLFGKKARAPHRPIWSMATGALAAFALALTLVSCGGYATSGTANRGTASIDVTARAGAISHTVTVRVTVQ